MSIVRTVIAPALVAGLILGAAGCASVETGPTAPDPVGDLLVNINGQGNWSMACEGETNRGDPVVAEERGRGNEHLGKVFLTDLQGASCSYAAGDRPLTLSFEARGFACPFGDYDGGVCDVTLPAGSAGEFTLEPMDG